jgi:putative endopeptidase
MKKRILSVLLTFSLVLMAGSTGTVNAKQPAEDNVITGGKPWIDSDFKENISADLKTDPKDDLHLYANKDWILKSDIPDGYTNWSHYLERELDVKKQCIGLLKDESLKSHDAELIQTYNSLVLDWDARNEIGVSELQDMYDQISAIKSIDDITKFMTDKKTADEAYDFLSYSLSVGYNDPEKYLVMVGSPDLLLSDSAEYSKRTELGDMYYGYKKDMFVCMAEKMGMSSKDAEECFDTAIGLETELAKKILTTEEKLKDDYVEKTNNEMSFKEMVSLTKEFPLEDIFTGMNIKYDGIYIVEEPDYLKWLDKIYTDENVEAMKDLILVQYLLKYPTRIDKETFDKRNELFGKYFGVSGTVSDEEMAYREVVSLLQIPMQKVYVEKYGSAEDKKKMEDLCKEVIDTYRELLSENDWASDETKEYAIEKLDKITIYAAYPEKFRDTSNLDIEGCSLIEAGWRIEKWNNDYMKSLIGTNKDHEMWFEGCNILECNAFYDRQSNSINMLLGMMGEPFFSKDMSTEELYASIAAFWVGHEISHAFDNNGAQFDAYGQYRDWWTAEDKKEFQRRVSKMSGYLDNIVAFGDYHFNGTNVVSEMAADMTGLQCALRMAKKVDGFDYDKFFTKYAQMNVNMAVYGGEVAQVLQGEHPLYYSRTNVPVQQFEEFYETYDVKEGDAMYLAPEDRLVIW